MKALKILIFIALFTILALFLKTKISEQDVDSVQSDSVESVSSARPSSTTSLEGASELQDEIYKEFLASASFEDAIQHIIRKSEEHVQDSPTKEDYIKKLDVMTYYIDYDISILRRNFDFFVSYYTLNAFDQREERMAQMEYLLNEAYLNELRDTRYCLDFFKEIGRKVVNYSDLSQVVTICAADERKRDIVFDYVNFLRGTKGDHVAAQEYTKLRLLYNELPEYESF